MVRGLGSFIIGTVVLAVLFWTLEALWPEDRNQPKWRKDSLNDLIYWFFDSYIVRGVASIAVIIAIGLTARTLPRLPQNIISMQPSWLQVLEILLIGDIIGYWLHRIFHINTTLWPFHAVHHSPEKIDWLAAARVHPLETMVNHIGIVLPLYFLGFSGGVLSFYAPFLAIYPIFLHANLAWNYGPLRYLIASPAWHRWHHSSDLQALNKNFSGLFPFVDAIFGTAYFPRYGQPQKYGLHNQQMPTSFTKQLLYPFRPKQPNPTQQVV
jgi:sterol desaturase/sphingolipid hydroxylase (fatty acid hydroxylase superfamily)